MSSDSSTSGSGRTVRIGKYEVLAHIASGGMGAVYRAYDSENACDVALKVMNPEMAARPAMLERFKREARSGQKLRHENIVSLFECAEANGTWYLAMEFVEGRDLHDYIEEKGTLEPEETRQIMLQAARALQHAHKSGIVHRDIKPSNFLLTEKNGQLLVKLTDLGLAREANAEEFRVTRSGTTVGTVDYISPEQARDSGMADIRSDLYSLGCTWFHMLAGQTPFCEGGLAERLLKHMTEPPPDVRTFNPRVSDELVEILEKLLAKKPEDRYQTPQELIQDLASLQPTAKPAARKSSDGSPSDSQRRAASSTKKTGRKKSSQSLKDTEVKSKTVVTRRKRRQSKTLGIVIGSVLLLVGVGLFLMSNRGGERTPNREVPPSETPVAVLPSDPPPPVPAADPPPAIVVPAPPSPSVDPPRTAPKPPLPILYRPSLPIDAAALRQEFLKPWLPEAPLPSETPVLTVSRATATGTANQHPSLSAAIAAAPPGKITIIEIQDNGPLYEVGTRVEDRTIVVRAAAGFRPLLAWDIARAVDERRSAPVFAPNEPFAWFDLKKSSLTLQGLDLVAQWPDRLSTRGTLFQSEQCSLTLENCTVSVAGKSRDSLEAARVAGAAEKPSRIRWSCSLVRGGALTAVALDSPGAEVLIDRCLVVGGEAPLLKCRNGLARPPELRVQRSTLVAGRQLLRVEPGPLGEREPALRWRGWDALLARSGRGTGGELLSLGDGVTTRNMQWQAINCLYSGWETLLAGEMSIGSTDLSAWRVRWGRAEGEEIRRLAWPTTSFAELAEAPTSVFRTASSALEFAATEDPTGPLGCDPAQLPPARDNWLALTYERFVAPPVEAIDDLSAPEIPPTFGDIYTGEMLDLSGTDSIDVGLRLQQMARTQKLGPRVVLHLVGSGERRSSPIRVPKGTSLVLYCEPPRDRTGTPLTLMANVGPDAPTREAFVFVEGGGLDILNGDLRLPDASVGRVLPHVVKVSGGDLRLYRTRLQGPLHQPGGEFRSAISLQGSDQPTLERARTCVLEQSALLSGVDGIQVRGTGARLQLQDSLVLAGNSGIDLDPGKAFTDRASTLIVTRNTTWAARQAAVHLRDVATQRAVIEPIVVQTYRCAFLNPFPQPTHRGGILSYDGQALARGSLIWQGDSDTFDRRLHFRVAPRGALPDRPQTAAAWLSHWGSPGERDPLPEVTLTRLFDRDQWPLERLQLPTRGDRRLAAGADLEQLGLLRRGTTRPK